MADLTLFYRWGPLDAARLPLSDVAWWASQATRQREAVRMANEVPT